MVRRQKEATESFLGEAAALPEFFDSVALMPRAGRSAHAQGNVPF